MKPNIQINNKVFDLNDVSFAEKQGDAVLIVFCSGFQKKLFDQEADVFWRCYSSSALHLSLPEQGASSAPTVK